MLNKNNLKVSLTKHGAHKIAQLLVKFGARASLEHTLDESLAIDINLAQASKNLSAYDGNVPLYWDDIIKLGQNTINAAVLVSIIFSHHELINAMAETCSDKHFGSLTADKFTNRKGFTNFKNDIYELGFSIHASANEVIYDLTKIISNAELGYYVRFILEDKLKQAGWNEQGDGVAECIALGFNEVFGLSTSAFKEWLSGSGVTGSPLGEEDEFEVDSIADFIFRPGHLPRSATRTAFQKPVLSPASQLLHNYLQTRLYEQLVVKHSAEQIGTEVPVGIGRACVDICLVVDKQHTVFYEIKTNPSARACVREALGQALEYAYWPDVERAQKLIIVGPADITESLVSYMQLLRTRFGHCVYYQKVDQKSGDFCGKEV